VKGNHVSGKAKGAARDWLILCAYSLVIFLTLPAARAVQKSMQAAGLEGLINGGPVLLVLIVLLAVFYALWFRRRERRPSTYFYLVNLGIAYFLVFQSLAEIPVERVHLLEYGLASYLALRAARHHRQGAAAWLMAAVLVFDIGFIDEVIQYFLPERVYDPRDVVTNAISGLLGLGVVLVLSRRPPAKSPEPSSDSPEY